MTRSHTSTPSTYTTTLSLGTTLLHSLFFLLLLFIPATLAEFPEGRSKWGDEFCRNKFCAVMSYSKQKQCCQGYKECCAYVNLYRRADPFSYLESHEEVDTIATQTQPPPPPLNPPLSPRLSTPSPTFSHRDIYVGPPKPMRLREEETSSRHPPSLSLTRNHNHHHNNHRHHNNHQPPHRHHHHRHRHHLRRPPPRPAIQLLDGGEDLLKTSYNDKLVKDQERVCKHSYCSLLTTSQHKLCCSIFDTCCSYSNYHKIFDLFHPDNGNKRR